MRFFFRIYLKSRAFIWYYGYGIEVNGKPPFRELIRQLRFGITLFNLSLRRSKATVATLGRVAATRKGSRKDVVVTALWGDSSLTLDTTVIRLAVTNTYKKEKRAVL